MAAGIEARGIGRPGGRALSRRAALEVAYQAAYGYAWDAAQPLRDADVRAWLARWFPRQADPRPDAAAQACGLVDALADVLCARAPRAADRGAR